MPKVSICSQVFNQKEWMKDMIKSVVQQSLADWELLIVDDGSTNDLKSVIDEFKDQRIKYFRFDQNKGVPFGTNVAIQHATGDYLCLIAADEIYWKDKLKVQTEYLDSHPEVHACWGIPGSGSWKGEFPLGPRPEWEQNNYLGHNRSQAQWMKTMLNLELVPIGGVGLMMRKSVADELGPLDESLSLFSDHEFYTRFFAKGYKGVIIPYRVGIDKPAGEDSVRARNSDKVAAELAYVRKKHPLPVPEVNGKVTVGIPCYNHAAFVGDALQSVLDQTHPVHEILVLNDCSTDNFNEVVKTDHRFKDPRVKVMSFTENKGIQEALNHMAFNAEGDFFVVLSSDDTIDPTLVEKCLAAFKANPWLEFVATQTDFRKEDMKTPADKNHPFLSIQSVGNLSREQWFAELHVGNKYFGVGMYRTQSIKDVGGWEKKYKVISDYQMYLKLLQRENIFIIEEPLTHTRLHDKQYSLLVDKKRQEELPWLYHNARKPFYRPLMKVIIATPFYELKGFSPYITSLTQTLRLLTAMGIDWRFMELSGDSYVHRARNTMVDMFLRDPDATDLFFLDSDMSWNPEAFVKMCLLPDPVVGAAYPVKNNWQAWTSIPKIYQTGDGATSLQGRELGDGTALVEAQVLAGGFLRIKRAVFERFKDHFKDLWYEEPTTDPSNPNYRYTAFFGAESIDHKFYGEDHCFAKRLREMGIQMFIYPNVDIVHWGYKDFAGNYDKWLRQSFNRDTSGEANNLDKFKQATEANNQPGQRMAIGGH